MNVKGKKFERTSFSPLTSRDGRLRSKRSLAEGEASGAVLGEVGRELEVESGAGVWLPEGPAVAETGEQDSLGSRGEVFGEGGLTGGVTELLTGTELQVAESGEVVDGSGLAVTVLVSELSGVEGVEGADEVGRTDGGLAGVQEGADKERVGVIETIVMPEVGAGTDGAGQAPCLGGSEGGGKGKEVGIETVGGIGAAGVTGASVLEVKAEELGGEV